MILSVALDGWSGRMWIDGEWGDRRISEAQSIREGIYSVLTDYLDKATAPI